MLGSCVTANGARLEPSDLRLMKEMHLQRQDCLVHEPDIFTQEQQQLSSIEVTGPAPAASCYALRVCSSGFPWTPLWSFEEQLAQRNTRPLVLRTLTQKSFLRGSASAALLF